MDRERLPDSIVWKALQKSEKRGRRLRRQRDSLLAISIAMGIGWVLYAQTLDVAQVDAVVAPATIPSAIVECASLHAVADESARLAVSSLTTLTAPTPAPTATPVPPGVDLGEVCFSEDMHLTEMWKVFCSGNQALAHDEYQQWLCNTAIELSNP